jgi:hypothetical protein
MKDIRCVKQRAVANRQALNMCSRRVPRKTHARILTDVQFDLKSRRPRGTPGPIVASTRAPGTRVRQSPRSSLEFYGIYSFSPRECPPTCGPNRQGRTDFELGSLSIVDSGRG